MAFNAITYQQSIRALALPVPDPHILSDIFAIEGDAMVRAVDAFNAGNEQAKNYLKGILYVVMPATRERLARRGLAVPGIGILISIGRHEGPGFSIKLKSWDEGGQDDGDDARYVRRTLARHLERAAAPAMSAGRFSGRQAPPRDEALQQVDLSPAETPWPDDDSETGSSPDGDRFKSFHVYGGKFAACFSEDTTQRGIHTIRVEATEASGQRTYNWKNKVAIQLSQRELPLMLATLMLWTSRFEARGHGQSNEKWMTLEAQPGKLYLSVQSKGTGARGIAIAPGDAYPITTMIVKQMLANDPFLSADLVFKLAKKQVEIMQHGQQQG